MFLDLYFELCIFGQQFRIANYLEASCFANNLSAKLSGDLYFRQCMLYLAQHKNSVYHTVGKV
jgi:hypothetical protein